MERLTHASLVKVNAGTRPKMTLVMRVNPAVHSITTPSMPISDCRGRCAGRSHSNTSTPSRARSRPPDAAEDGDNQVFGQELPHQPEPRGAEGAPDRKLTLTGLGSGQDRLATLTQAMRSTNPTAAPSASNAASRRG